MRFCIYAQQVKIRLAVDYLLRRAVEQVCQAGECDRRCVRPTGAIPLAFVARVRQLEPGMTLLGGGWTERREEPLRVHQLFPRHRLIRVRQVEVPRRITMQLTDINQLGRVAARQYFEELSCCVPEIHLC